MAGFFSKILNNKNMKNFIQKGKVIAFTATAAILAGAIVVIGALAGVAVTNIAIGETGSVNLEGVYSLPKVVGAITKGAKLYVIVADGTITTTASGNTFIGYAWDAAGANDATVNVLLAQ